MLDWFTIGIGIIAGGGLVPTWKWFMGWQRITLSLQLEPRRTPSTDPLWHDLVCLVKLRKGDRATLTLESVTVKLQSGETALLDYAAPEVRPAEADRPLNLTPGEETHFAAYCRVPKGAVCTRQENIRNMLAKDGGKPQNLRAGLCIRLWGDRKWVD